MTSGPGTRGTRRASTEADVAAVTIEVADDLLVREFAPGFAGEFLRGELPVLTPAPDPVLRIE